jgi:hypothetical protein
MRKFKEHVKAGGQVALTTDRWSGNNKLDYKAVTGYIITKDGEHISVLLDIIKLKEAVYNSVYLCDRLIAVTDSFNITNSIVSITRDNASPNNVMLDKFKARV